MASAFPQQSQIYEDEELQLADLVTWYPTDRTTLQGLLPTYKEFEELRLEPTEVPVYGKPFKHQKFLANLMVIVPSILLTDATGTGKTTAFQSVSEMFRDNPKYGIHKVFMITKNVQLTEWMKESLVSVTNPLGYPEFNTGSVVNQMGRKKKLTQFLSSVGTTSSGDTRETPYKMHFSTYASFVNKYQSMQNKDLVQLFSGSLLIIDEIHRMLTKYLRVESINAYAELRESDDFVTGKFKFEDARSIDSEYLFVHWLVQHVHRMKKIYSTATPIINQLSRIQGLINLLRTDGQFYMDRSQWNNIGDTQEGRDYLKTIFRGYIVYTREFDNNVSFDDFGEMITVNGDSFIMDNMEMVQGGPQTRAYVNSGCKTAKVTDDVVTGVLEQTGKDDTVEIETSGLCIDQRQASMFVYPDGAIDDPNQGTNKNPNYRWTSVITRSFSHISKGPKIHDAAKNIRVRVANPELSMALRDMNVLKTLSIRFWNIITRLNAENLARKRQEMASRSWFEYMIDVNNGIEILGMTLTAHGYRQFYMREGATDPQYDYMRYAIVTAKTDPAEKTAILRTMNQPDNYDGKVIRLFIGSSTVIEGISIRNVTVFDTDPQWTDGEKYQSQSRVNRAISHTHMTAMLERGDPAMDAIVDSRGVNGYKMLTNRHGTNGTIDIETHFYNSYPYGLSSNKTIESRVYASSRILGRKIGVINRLFKEIAVNCNLNTARNFHEGDVDGTRACDYMKCGYKCDDPIAEDQQGTNLSNYMILMMDEMVNKIVNKFSSFFSGRSEYKIKKLRDTLEPSETKFMSHAIEKILMTNVSTTNRFGQSGYIRIVGDTAFFSDDYVKHDWIASTWNNSAINITACTSTEEWVFKRREALRKGDLVKEVYGSPEERFPLPVMEDLSCEPLTIWFELVVDIYYRALDGLAKIPQAVLAKYIYAMNRLVYHYAATTKDFTPLFNTINVNAQGSRINNDESHVSFIFHAITIFKIKGTTRYVSNENDIGRLADNLRFYDRSTHTWGTSSNYIYRFANILREKRLAALAIYIPLSPFIRLVIPDDSIKVVSKKRELERRKVHGVMCKGVDVRRWLIAFGHQGGGDCETLLEIATEQGKMMYT